MRDDSPMLAARLTGRIVGAFFHVHTEIGFGFPEGIYANALAVELDRLSIRVAREVPVEVVYAGVSVGRYRLDMVVENAVLIEIKSTKALTDADTRQLLTYSKGNRLRSRPAPAFWSECNIQEVRVCQRAKDIPAH